MTYDVFAERSRSERRRRWRRIALAVLVVALAAALVWMIWFSSVLAVRDVEVAGRTTLKQSQVLSAADVPLGRPLARVDIAAIEGRVAALERVDTVDVSRSWPRTLSIEVVERETVVWATIDGEIRGIDRHGLDYRSYSSAPKDTIEARISTVPADDRLETTESIVAVVELIAAKDRGLSRQIQSVTAASKDSIELDLTEGRTVVWGSDAHGERKLTVLDSLIGIDATRYDVSAPDQPTTRQ
ncbi:MAG: FtsQ-type POTRA domain-containing protein [Aeromicrobium sp.]